MILLSSLEARLRNGLDAMLDTVLFRAIFTVGVICECLPGPFANSKSRVLYYGLIFAALSINFTTYIVDWALHAAKSRGARISRALHAEHRIEFSFRTHHFLLLFAAIGFVLFAFVSLP